MTTARQRNTTTCPTADLAVVTTGLGKVAPAEIAGFIRKGMHQANVRAKRLMESIPLTIVTKEKRMDGTGSYIISSTSSSSSHYYDRDEKPVATQNASNAVYDDDNDETVLDMDRENVLFGAHRQASSPGRAPHRWSTSDPSALAYDIDNDGVGDPEKTYNTLEKMADFLDQLFLQNPEAMTPDTIRMQKELRALLSEYKKLNDKAKESCKDYWPREFGFNLLSGAAAFLLCFGAGTAAASALSMPVVGWGVSTLLWALTERFIPLIRDTSWANRHADKIYPLLGNLIQSSARDVVLRCAGMEARNLNADEHNDIELSEITVKDFLEAWKGKMTTDDLPYYFYTFWYGVRYTIIAGMNLPATSPASLISLLVAGTMAGASTAVTMQYCRRCLYEPEENGDKYDGQRLTKALAMWEKELQILEKKKELLETYAASADGGDHLGLNLKVIKEILSFDEQLENVRIRANIGSSLWSEMSALWNPTRRPGDLRGEVAGKRSEFLAGLLAKGSVLGISTEYNYGVTMKLLEATQNVWAKSGIMWGQYGMLIVAFNARKEFELAYRGVLGLGLGIYDVVSEFCKCSPAPDMDDASTDNHLPQGELRSVSSTTELAASYRREKLRKANISQKTARDGKETSNDNMNMNGEGSDNRVKASNTTSKRDLVNSGRSGQSTAQGQKRGMVDSPSSPRDVPEDASHTKKADTLETSDEQRIDISDSSDSSE